MFIGEYRHSIDPKKRLAIPAKFRQRFKKNAVLTRGLDKCLFLYPADVWAEIAQKLGNMPVGEKSTRSFVRLMLSGATDAQLDSQGRILVPDYLKEYAGFQKETVIAGLYNRLEIWDKDSWNKYKQEAEKNQDEVAEQLGKLGVY